MEEILWPKAPARVGVARQRAGRTARRIDQTASNEAVRNGGWRPSARTTATWGAARRMVSTRRDVRSWPRSVAITRCERAIAAALPPGAAHASHTIAWSGMAANLIRLACAASWTMNAPSANPGVRSPYRRRRGRRMGAAARRGRPPRAPSKGVQRPARRLNDDSGPAVVGSSSCAVRAGPKWLTQRSTSHTGWANRAANGVSLATGVAGSLARRRSTALTNCRALLAPYAARQAYRLAHGGVGGHAIQRGQLIRRHAQNVTKIVRRAFPTARHAGLRFASRISRWRRTPAAISCASRRS